jgi:hypothetical protein
VNASGSPAATGSLFQNLALDYPLDVLLQNVNSHRKSNATDTTFALALAGVPFGQTRFFKTINTILSTRQALTSFRQALVPPLPDVDQHDGRKGILLPKPAPSSPLVGSWANIQRLTPLTQKVEEQVSPVVLHGSHIMGLPPLHSSSHYSPVNAAPSRLQSEAATSIYSYCPTERTSWQQWRDLREEIWKLIERMPFKDVHDYGFGSHGFKGR